MGHLPDGFMLPDGFTLPDGFLLFPELLSPGEMPSLDVDTQTPP